ncbi:hypothetical protein HDV00_006226 [Rhizophlyctis rosea]|nr:hypothetical protein HDV00_006226 [Rhizophlyctis rosea]
MPVPNIERRDPLLGLGVNVGPISIGGGSTKTTAAPAPTSAPTTSSPTKSSSSSTSTSSNKNLLGIDVNVGGVSVGAHAGSGRVDASANVPGVVNTNTNVNQDGANAHVGVGSSSTGANVDVSVGGSKSGGGGGGVSVGVDVGVGNNGGSQQSHTTTQQQQQPQPTSQPTQQPNPQPDPQPTQNPTTTTTDTAFPTTVIGTQTFAMDLSGPTPMIIPFSSSSSSGGIQIIPNGAQPWPTDVSYSPIPAPPGHWNDPFGVGHAYTAVVWGGVCGMVMLVVLGLATVGRRWRGEKKDVASSLEGGAAGVMVGAGMKDGEESIEGYEGAALPGMGGGYVEMTGPPTLAALPGAFVAAGRQDSKDSQKTVVKLGAPPKGKNGKKGGVALPAVARVRADSDATVAPAAPLHLLNGVDTYFRNNPSTTTTRPRNNSATLLPTRRISAYPVTSPDAPSTALPQYNADGTLCAGSLSQPSTPGTIGTFGRPKSTGPLSATTMTGTSKASTVRSTGHGPGFTGLPPTTTTATRSNGSYKPGTFEREVMEQFPEFRILGIPGTAPTQSSSVAQPPRPVSLAPSETKIITLPTATVFLLDTKPEPSASQPLAPAIPQKAQSMERVKEKSGLQRMLTGTPVEDVTLVRPKSGVEEWGHQKGKSIG